MTQARVIAVSRGRGFDADWAGRLRRTAIDKRPVGGPVRIGPTGVDGDEQVDVHAHGGEEQAVYVYAREDYDWWEGQLGRPLRDGLFGENLTTVGIDGASILVGERWRIGEVELQATSPRIPCATFAGWMAEPGWVKRFAAALRTGAYFRVLTPGTLRAGDPVEIVHRPEGSVTISESVRAYYGDRELLRRFLAAPGRSAKWKDVEDARDAS